jgi:hypothetical protein
MERSIEAVRRPPDRFVDVETDVAILVEVSIANSRHRHFGLDMGCLERSRAS